MAWTKIPAEHHPLFLSALPRDPRVSTVLMFGGIAAKTNGQMFAGLFARSALVKLSPADLPEALALDGAEPFDPMGTGRVMHNTVLLPESVMESPEELREWIARAFAHVRTLPPKTKGVTKKKPAPKKPRATTTKKKPAPTPKTKLAAKATKKAAPRR